MQQQVCRRGVSSSSSGGGDRVQYVYLVTRVRVSVSARTCGYHPVSIAGLLRRASPRRLHAQQKLTPFVRGVSRRLAWASEACTLTLVLQRYFTPRSITPSPDSFLQLPAQSPCLILNPQFPHHVLHTWQCAAAIAIQTLEASHSHICCTYTTHAPRR
jgi:hypothetical protein